MTCFLDNINEQGMETPSDEKDEDGLDLSDAEILDQITTNRGELKLRNISSGDDIRRVQAR